MKTLESFMSSLIEEHPKDAAEAIGEVEAVEAAGLLKDLDDRPVGLLLDQLVPQKAAEILHEFDLEKARDVVRAMNPRQASLALLYLDKGEREDMLGRLGEKVAADLQDLLQYPENTAGGMMEPRVASIPDHLTVEETIEFIRKTKREHLVYLYVTTPDGKLLGVLNMRELLLASPDQDISSLVHQDVLCVPATMNRDDVVSVIKRHKFLALPVTDEDGAFIGVIRHREALRAMQLEAFGEMQKMVGGSGDERALSPLSTVIKGRLPWLYINLLTAFLASAVVGLFEGVIAKVTALAVLLPVVSGQAGNAGSQALAVVMRGLALREIRPGMSGRIISKEVLAGLINGLAVAVVTSAGVYVWSRQWTLSAVIGLAMVITMGIAGLAGAAIPMVLKAMKKDPAQSSTIFLTTITDVVGFACFLGLATVMFFVLSK